MAKFKYTLNPKQRAWVKALESGTIKQGKGRLVRGQRFCCLGVACQLMVDKKWGSLRRIGAGFLDDEDGGVKRHVDFLPTNAMETLGFRGPVGTDEIEIVEIGGDEFWNLAEANDYGVSFKDIAKFVRANPEKVFELESLVKKPISAK